MIKYDNIPQTLVEVGNLLLNDGKTTTQTTWQDVSVTTPMHEYFRHSFSVDMYYNKDILNVECFANDWAELHFQERIDCLAFDEKLNPGNSYKQWPFYVNSEREDSNHKVEGKFSHTYMERFWPRNAVQNIKGIRFLYGDLGDVIELLKSDPNTRKAFFPIFYPEDTGSRKDRVPCTLGYLFNIRDNKLHLTYYIRSCDFIRHFNHDLYLTIRLAQYVLSCLNNDSIRLGTLVFHIESLHVFTTDLIYLKKLVSKYEQYNK